jgi:hypothetical protein
MGDRYWVSGVQLGLIKGFLEERGLPTNIIDKEIFHQFLGRIEEWDKEDLEIRIKMNKYKKELEKWNAESIWNLKKSKEYFKGNMTEKQKEVFDYLVEKLEEEKIIYRYSDNFYIILKNTPYFYFEMFDDLSADYTNFQNKQKEVLK